MHELGFLPRLSMTAGAPAMMPPVWPRDLPGWPLELAAQRFSNEHHGDFDEWTDALAHLPAMTGARVSYGDTVTINGAVDNTELEQQLRRLHPWRKGPFQIGDITIDTEWRSDWKWARVRDALGDMSGQRVLDIGCGNGYFGWRMLDQGASEVIGVDPTLLFCMQHLAIRQYTSDARNHVLPLKAEELPDTVQFDTVLSMGVIYHRRDPLEHTQTLAGLTRAGGRVVLESLVVDAAEDLIPKQRYARMRNVWCIPTVQSMNEWLSRAGFSEVRTIDITPTNTDEQRSTDWMRFESLADCLDPGNSTLTVEGYPAPLRAVLVARKP